MQHRNRDYNPGHRHNQEQHQNWHPSQGEQEDYRDFSDRWHEPRPFFQQPREHYRPEQHQRHHYEQQQHQNWPPEEEKHRLFQHREERRDRDEARDRRMQDPYWHHQDHTRPESQHQQAVDRWSQPVYRPYFQEHRHRHDDFYDEDRERFRG